jgi:hypothetical protein
MSALSDYAENKILDALLRGQAFPAIANVYIALLTTNDNDADSSKVEVPINASTNYARAAVAATLANWKSTQGDATASTGNTGQTSNANTVTFNAPGTTAWGSITGFAVYDAATGGNLLFYGSLGTAKTVNANDPAPSFAAGSLTFQIDN